MLVQMTYVRVKRGLWDAAGCRHHQSCWLSYTTSLASFALLSLSTCVVTYFMWHFPHLQMQIVPSHHYMANTLSELKMFDLRTHIGGVFLSYGLACMFNVCQQLKNHPLSRQFLVNITQ